MSYPTEQTEDLKRYCEKLSLLPEAGVPFLLMEGLRLPAGCQPAVCDALLCPSAKDGYKTREELEIACRRYLMHYIDIGMDVHGKERPVIGGQIIQSSPGGLCMRCMGFLTDEKLAAEAARYGDAGHHPQVIWPNGVLASTAVGLAVDLITNWTQRNRTHAYLAYDGNEGTLRESLTLRNLMVRDCPHFSIVDVGDPLAVEL
jgi:hypothetical protein